MRRLEGVVILMMMGGLLRPAAVEAQLDPLLFVKRLPPNVIVVVDTSLSMLDDGQGNFYDPTTFSVADDRRAAEALGVNGRALRYRRVYRGLALTRANVPGSRYVADTITAVDDRHPEFDTFWKPTRWDIARRGLVQAVGENRDVGQRWALVGLRQRNPRWRPPSDCDRPVAVADEALQATGDVRPCAAGGPGQYGVYPPLVDAPNYSLRSSDGARLRFGTTSWTEVVEMVDRPVNDPEGLIPAGRDSDRFEDRPLAFALEDAMRQVRAAIANEASAVDCRNTVVLLLTAGGDSGDRRYRRSNDVVAVARRFQSVSGHGLRRRVPIYVAAIQPEGPEDELRQIATESGGRFFTVTTDADVSRVVNLAIQSGYGRPLDFNQGLPSEYQPVSPVVGTVDLTSAKAATGRPLPESVVHHPQGEVLPQRRNVMVTAGFELNGLGEHGIEGVVRAFRTFRPVRDPEQPGGFTFESDGTALWPNVDGRVETAGRARTTKDPNDRNIFTYVPGRGLVALTVENAPTLSPHLGSEDPESLIAFIRKLPLGAVVGSTPAIQEPPSADPPPDDDYGRPGVPDTYAEAFRDRRSIIWVGGNNGMIHAIDARTGFEVWAFVPYNLLPKLRTLRDGQSIGRFDYFVDSSPKLAEVKLDGRWRTVLVFGQAYGGTYYQALDVSQAGMDGPSPESDDHAGVLASFARPSQVSLLWSFPRYDQFDPTVSVTLPVSDGFPGGEVRFLGDLRASATPAEKTVGFTWSVPAVAPLTPDRSVNAAIVGSGYFPPVETDLPGRGAGAPAAGNALYVIDMETGALIGGSAACGGNRSTGCVEVGDRLSNARKNAIQADPAVVGSAFSPHVARAAYVGDIDGIYRRFELDGGGQITHTTLLDADAPIYAASSVTLDTAGTPYLFFGTGSDLLPADTDGGGLTTRAFGLREHGGGGGASVSFRRDLQTGTAIERLTSAPAVAGHAVFFTTVVVDPTRPCSDFRSRLYGMSYLGGAAYDTNGDGAISARESPVIAAVDGRATAPFVSDGHLYFGTSGNAGSGIEMFGDPESFNNGVGQTGIRLLSWRGTQ